MVGHVTIKDIADIWRAIAIGFDKEGRTEEACAARAKARQIEFRDGWRGVRRLHAEEGRTGV